MSVTDIATRQKKEFDELVKALPPLDKGGGPPNDGDMETRVSRIEALLPTLATKADVGEIKGEIGKTQAAVSESKSDIIKWGSTIGVSLTAIIIAVLAFLINRANPPAAQGPTPQPIIVQVPAPAPTPAPSPPAKP